MDYLLVLGIAYKHTGFAIPPRKVGLELHLVFFVERQPALPLSSRSVIAQKPECLTQRLSDELLKQDVHVDQEAVRAHVTPKGLELAVQQDEPRQADDMAVVLVQPVESGPPARASSGTLATTRSRGSRRSSPDPGAPPTSAGSFDGAGPRPPSPAGWPGCPR